MSFYKEVPGRQTTLESTLKFDTEPKEGSTNPVTSEGVKNAIDGAVGDAAEVLQDQIDEIAEKAGSGYIPKGEASVATLNGLSGQENGDLYTMTDAGTLTDGSLAVVAGDTVAWDATNEVWYKAMDYAPRQYGTNEVHNLPTTITAFRTGDVIPVDGPSGTAKMGKDDLLKETAENAERFTASKFESVNGSVGIDQTTYHEYKGIPEASVTGWSALGKHISIPVSYGMKIKLVSDGPAYYTFMGSSFIDGDKTSDSPYPSSTYFRRFDTEAKTEYDIVVNPDDKFLVLVTLKGDQATSVKWTITFSENKDLRLDIDSELTNEVNKSSSDFTHYKGCIPYNPNATNWYYVVNTDVGKHVDIKLRKNWTYAITPTANNTVIVIHDGTYKVGDKISSDSIDNRIYLVEANTTAYIVGSDSQKSVSVNVVDGAGSPVPFNVKIFYGKVQKIPYYIAGLTQYNGIPNSSAPPTWYAAAKHRALKVNTGDIVTFTSDIVGTWAVVDSTYVPGKHTSGTVPISSRSKKRFTTFAGVPNTIKIKSDEQWIIFTSVNGVGDAVNWNVEFVSECESEQSFRIRYAHWNIGHFSMGTTPGTTIPAEDAEAETKRYRKFVNKLGADVLAICEDNPEFALGGTTSLDAVYSCFLQKFQGDKFGYDMNSVYSNLKSVIDQGYFFFTTAQNNRYLHEIVVKLNGKDVYIAEVHLDFISEAYTASQIAEIIARYADKEYVIVSGDFNVDGRENLMEAFKTAGYRMALIDYMPSTPTYSGNSQTPPSQSCIDNIVCKGFAITNVDVHEDSAELSDHLAVSCDLIMN